MEPATNKGQLLTPFQRQYLQNSLQSDLSKSHRQRIYIMLLADEGKSQTEICQILKCCPATVRFWVHIARSGGAHRWKAFSRGRPKKINDEYLERLKQLVNRNPRDYGYPFRQWTADWLTKHLAKEFAIQITAQHINRLLKRMGLSTRLKASNKDTKNLNLAGKRISIIDIQLENISDSLSFLPIDLTNLGED